MTTPTAEAPPLARVLHLPDRPGPRHPQTLAGRVAVASVALRALSRHVFAAHVQGLSFAWTETGTLDGQPVLRIHIPDHHEAAAFARRLPDAVEVPVGDGDRMWTATLQGLTIAILTAGDGQP